MITIFAPTYSSDLGANTDIITHYPTLTHHSMIDDLKRIITQLQSIVDDLEKPSETTYQEVIMQTPNVTKGVIIKPKGIILHHTAGSVNGSVSWAMLPTSKVSYHCIVAEDGKRYILAHDYQRTWHAGASEFNGLKDCNSWMLGIAVGGNTLEREISFSERDSVAKWCLNQMMKYGFGLDMITTHGRVATPKGRRIDVDVRAEKAIKDRIRELMEYSTINPS
jgi:N-acetyl-anhydromuramyl-L-alanine amidase AmpD